MTNPPHILNEILRFAQVVQRHIKVDRQRLCFLVSDGEWDRLVSYQKTMCYILDSDIPDGMVSMSLMNIEIVKRTAIVREQHV